MTIWVFIAVIDMTAKINNIIKIFLEMFNNDFLEISMK